MDDPTEQPSRIRIGIVQPALAAYRVPIFRALAQQPGVDLHVWYGAVEGLRNAEPDGFKADFVPMKRQRVGRRTATWHQAQWKAAGEDLDALFLLWDVQYLSLVPALLRARRRGIRTILWGHGFSKRESPVRRAIRNRVGRLADAVIVYNRTAAANLVTQGFSPERVFVALNTIDTSRCRRARQAWLRTPRRLKAFRERWRLGPHTILHVSRWSRERNIPLLLRAAAALRRELPDLRVVLIGQGHEGPEMRAEIERLGLEEVVVTPGALYDEEALAPFFLCARAFAFPEDVGLSLLHALAYGVPVVTHADFQRHAPEAEALVDGTNSLLYRYRDEEHFIAQLRRLLLDDELFARLSQAAFETAKRDYGVDVMVAGFLEAAGVSAQP